MLNDQIQIKSDSFDGPLSLLLMLIQKEEMSIRDLDLKEITNQYLSYLNKLEKLDFNIAGDYLYLAATLILLKSKDCLTEEDKSQLEQIGQDFEMNINSHSELVKRLEELERVKFLTTKITALEQRGRDTFVKPKVNRKAIIDSILSPLKLEVLTDAMMEVISRNSRKYAVVKKDKISIRAKLEEFKADFSVGDELVFKSLISKYGGGEKIEIIITFISLLELARLGKISIFQNDECGEIYMKVISDLNNFDVREADGFDPEEDENNEESPVKNNDQEIDLSNAQTTTGTIQ